MNPVKIVFLWMMTLILCLPSINLAQESLEDVVYLKNGSVIHGVIIEQVPNKSIKIQTHDGNIFVFEMDDITKFTKEPRIEILPLGKRTFFINPLGILQFGPIFGGEFSISPNTYFTAHVRYSALGLLYQVIASDGFEDDISIKNMALGIGMKQLLGNPGSPNRFYLGGYAEYGWDGVSGDVGETDEWKSKAAHMTIMGNFGYRWRFPSSLFLNLGLIAGPAKLIKSNWWYIDAPNEIFQGDLDNYFLAMLELSIGWER